MTGYGRKVISITGKNITIELKALNNKQIDINAKLPPLYREKEMEIRNIISEHLQRGKIDLSIHLEITDASHITEINHKVVSHYYQQLLEIKNTLNPDSNEDILSAILRLPDTLKNDKEEIDENEWKALQEGLNDAIDELDQFRLQEGQAMLNDLTRRIELIKKYLENLDSFEESRIKKIKERIEKNLHEFIKAEEIDKSRFEQEIIYYLEKLDITEEKVRLDNHCKYFMDTIASEQPVGKKLNFISQEIGREINTIGSKANNSDIQRMVVKMKDELEKIKEQVSNVL
jgi:uncharacterized protein (TIGR00255 family)